jgi:Fur family transcriptional regulator, iron response regulator
METFGTSATKARFAFDWCSGPLATTIRSRLRAANLRSTQQRVSLAGLLFVAGERHVTAKQLYREAKALNLPVSLATVHNTLAQFREAGLLREIAVCSSTAWYDTDTGSHCHFFDEDRNVVSDIPYDIARDLRILPPRGRKVIGVDIVVRLRGDDEIANQSSVK